MNIKNYLRYLVSRPTLLSDPGNTILSISDLFPWRNTNSFQTSFILQSICSLYDDPLKSSYTVYLYIFHKSGSLLNVHSLSIKPLEAYNLLLSNYLVPEYGEYGSFAIFHCESCQIIANNSSYIAERGYLGFTYMDSLVPSKVHGNSDAIALHKTLKTETLTAPSLFPRKYRVQYQFLPDNHYELFYVNSSRSLKCYLINLITDNDVTQEHKFVLKPNEAIIINLPSRIKSYRIETKSKMWLVRPIIFSYSINNTLDVFHG